MSLKANSLFIVCVSLVLVIFSFLSLRECPCESQLGIPPAACVDLTVRPWPNLFNNISLTKQDYFKSIWDLSGFIQDPWPLFHDFAMNFTCQHSYWCDSWFNDQDTIKVQHQIISNQYRNDCLNAKFLIIKTNDWQSNAVNYLHHMSFYLAMALQEDRILIEYPIEKVNRQRINAQSTNDACFGRIDCFFQSITNCTKDHIIGYENAMNLANIGMDHMLERLVVVTHPNRSDYDPQKFVPDPWMRKGRLWWKAQAINFLSRPKESFLKEHWWPLQSEVFKQTNGQPPHPLISICVPSVGLDRLERTIDEYMSETVPIARNHSMKDIYVFAEESQLIEMLQKSNYSKEFQFHAMSRSQWVIKETDILTDEINRKTFANLIISMQADMFVGRRTNRICRWIDELRKVRGKSKVPYLAIKSDLWIDE